MEQVDLFTRITKWSDRVPSPIACRRISQGLRTMLTAARASVPRGPWTCFPMESRRATVPADRIRTRRATARRPCVHRARRGAAGQRGAAAVVAGSSIHWDDAAHSSPRSPSRAGAPVFLNGAGRDPSRPIIRTSSPDAQGRPRGGGRRGDRRTPSISASATGGHRGDREIVQIDADGRRSAATGGRRRIVGDSRSVLEHSRGHSKRRAGGSWLRGLREQEQAKAPGRRSTSGRTSPHPPFPPRQGAGRRRPRRGESMFVADGGNWWRSRPR